MIIISLFGAKQSLDSKNETKNVSIQISLCPLRENVKCKQFAIFIFLMNHVRTGALAIAVPGEIAGYWEAHKKFGKLPWAELFHPSIKLCNEGYNLTRAQYDALLIYPPNIQADPTLR